MIITLIISSMIIGVLLCCFKLEIMRKEYIISTMKSQLRIDPYEEYRVHLLTKLNKHIRENIKAWNDEDVHNLLLNLKADKVYYGNSFVQYNLKDKEILLSLYTKEGPGRMEYYKYKVDQKEKNRVIFYLVKMKN